MKFHIRRKKEYQSENWASFCKKTDRAVDRVFTIDLEVSELHFGKHRFDLPGFGPTQGDLFDVLLGKADSETGKKFDTGKPIMAAIPPNALLEVAEVLTFGAKKYGRDNWNQVDNAETRYLDAALRHINAYQRGEVSDPESTKHTLAHAICCLMFIIEKQKREAK